MTGEIMNDAVIPEFSPVDRDTKDKEGGRGWEAPWHHQFLENLEDVNS